MSAFRSLQGRYDEENSLLAGDSRPWPAVYRDVLPNVNLDDYALQIRTENQLPKPMNLKQLSALPSFTESRRITSKAGWTYYGQWKGVTFQTLFTMFSTPTLYPWVRLESLNGQYTIMERAALLNYRVVLSADGLPLSPLYGGPLWVHNFDDYVEYSIPYLKNITLMQGDHQPVYPMQAIGFTPEQARVAPGAYYAIHHEKIANL